MFVIPAVCLNFASLWKKAKVVRYDDANTHFMMYM